jgi:cobaltochelatase CobN
MHLLARDVRALDDAGAAVDLEQTPGELVFLSFSDSELGLLARVHEQNKDFPTLRCAPLAQLKHPYSVDLYIEQVARHGRLVIVRLLGGKDYWAYGVDELAAAARKYDFVLAVVPGDGMSDERLLSASTLSDTDALRIWSFFQDGGAENLRNFLCYASTLIGRPLAWRDAAPVANAGRFDAACRAAPGAPCAALVFYRSLYLSDDVAPIISMSDALHRHGFAVEALYAASLKDRESETYLSSFLEDLRPDVIVNATAFSARSEGKSVLDGADAPVLQVALATSTREAWSLSARGANGADLAMNIVLPELDGRIFTRAISFKAASTRRASEFDELLHAPEEGRIEHVAALARAWAHLRAKGAADKRLALVVSNYPARRGRAGYAIGLDAEQSVSRIAELLRAQGYPIEPPPLGLMRRLEDAVEAVALPLADYRALFDELPKSFRERVIDAWGAPEDDPAYRNGAFHLACVAAGSLLVALQPDRGARGERRASYHDLELPPRHAYIGFYLWLRHVERIDALIHLGTHGTLEWLPGKSVMLAEDCVPEILLGPTPVIYPFIVNDPGEAAQAKRRLGAVTIGHLTPPLVDAELSGAVSTIENLLDEYSNALALDPRRAKLIAGAILDESERNGLASEAGIEKGADIGDALTRLDAWLCDIKEMRVGDGLHIFGHANDADAMRMLCAKREASALLAALDGRFVEPGPAGAPSRSRVDVLPTGRNLYCIDPRHVPTRTAYDIGRRAAQEVVARHAQEQGEWPRRIMIDLWGSATIRTGGEDFAQALALIGATPVWDNAARVVGFEIEPMAKRDFPRVDVSLHISGLFRDMFPVLIGLFHDAAGAVAALDEDEQDNPLTLRGPAEPRIFGVAPGAYGLGVSEIIARGDWSSREDLARTFLDAAGHAYDRVGDASPAPAQFSEQVKAADALVHVQDMAEADLLSGSAFADFEGGFAAANKALGGSAALWRLDATRSDSLRVRSLSQDIARVARARLANRQWLRGQMRHGHRGAGEIAEAIDNLFAFAATSGLVTDALFDLVYSATLDDEEVLDFFRRENPHALAAIARVFREAERRSLWRVRRNSVLETLERLMEQSDEPCS